MDIDSVIFNPIKYVKTIKMFLLYLMSISNKSITWIWVFTYLVNISFSSNNRKQTINFLCLEFQVVQH